MFKSKIAVVCFSKKTFNEFIHMTDNDERKKFTFVCNVDGTRGMRVNQFIKLHDSYKIRDLEEVLSHLTARVRRENG